jgi:Leucine-rich repeat (LRR) protein
MHVYICSWKSKCALQRKRKRSPPHLQTRYHRLLRINSHLGLAKSVVCGKELAVTTSTGHVIQLNLRNPYDPYTAFEAFNQSQLGGVISDSLLELKHLHYLDLSWNCFEDDHIPSFFGYLRNLRYLNLSNAGFVGTIPHQLANLSNLHSLDIHVSSCKLTILNGYLIFLCWNSST